jgi:hypothetical protein
MLHKRLEIAIRWCAILRREQFMYKPIGTGFSNNLEWTIKRRGPIITSTSFWQTEEARRGENGIILEEDRIHLLIPAVDKAPARWFGTANRLIAILGRVEQLGVLHVVLIDHRRTGQLVAFSPSIIFGQLTSVRHHGTARFQVYQQSGRVGVRLCQTLPTLVHDAAANPLLQPLPIPPGVKSFEVKRAKYSS